FYIGIARTKVLTWNAIVMALVNVVFDYGLIFGNLGMPEMGIGGAALASVISELASTLFFVIFTLKTVDLQKYGFRRVRFQWAVVKRVLDISVFMMIQYLFSIGTWMLFFVFIENYLGERPLAISNIVRSFYMIFTIPSNALAATTNTLVSNTIGANRSHEVLNLVKRLSFLSLGVILTVGALVALFPQLIIRIYTNDPSLISSTIPPFYVLLATLPVYAIATVFFNAVSGTGNTKTALTFEIITLMFYIAYMSYIIIGLRSSVAVAWTTEIVYWFFLFVFSLIYMRSGKWKNKKI
ncbi:MAG: MATE family efflux transporter, partial [Petrimonas sp.]|nr:MATE family efflux transporter [Petrimonas sp.]